jgi:hypothetical protein
MDILKDIFAIFGFFSLLGVVWKIIFGEEMK